MDVLLYVILGIVAFTVIAKALVKLASGRMERELLAGADARAIRKAIDEVGSFDGSPAARERAIATFIDLAENGPLPTGSVAVSELARSCADNLTVASGPILLETAWTVVGAYRVSFPDEPSAASRSERDRDLRAAALFSALFESWTKEMVKRYRIGTPAGVQESRRRMALAIDLILDRCERRGLLESGSTD